MLTKNAEPAKLIEKTAEKMESEKIVQPPVWAALVKTGVSRERAPDQKNWWYIRSAGVLRKIYLDGPVGVERLRTYYGGRKNRGHKPEHFYKGSGAVLRLIVRQLEKSGMVKTQDKKGRVVTPKGQSFMDKIAKDVMGQNKAA